MATLSSVLAWKIPWTLSSLSPCLSLPLPSQPGSLEPCWVLTCKEWKEINLKNPKSGLHVHGDGERVFALESW